jgi:hypothetical protein
MDKKSRSGSGINIPDHIFPRAYKQLFGFKILKFFDADPDPGSGIVFTLDPGSRMEKFGSGIDIPDPQRWCFARFCFPLDMGARVG